jgi:hypothetical protein
MYSCNLFKKKYKADTNLPKKKKINIVAVQPSSKSHAITGNGASPLQAVIASNKWLMGENILEEDGLVSTRRRLMQLSKASVAGLSTRVCWRLLQINNGRTDVERQRSLVVAVVVFSAI